MGNKISYEAGETGPQRTDMPGVETRWLITEALLGVSNIAVAIAVLPPGSGHALHRHPNADEVVLVVKGSGIRLGATEHTILHEGEGFHTPASEWHGFANTTDQTTTIAIIYPGVGDPANAGYEPHPDGMTRLDRCLAWSD